MANPTQKPKTKKLLNQEALQASLESRWEDALRINDEFLSRFPRSAEALNRKGRAYIELRRLNEARDAYNEALKADPANMISRRNLQRLETLYNRAEGQPEEGAETYDSTIPRASVFILETGKTWIDELASAAEPGQLAEVSPGDKVQLKIQDGRVIVLSEDGMRLGELESRISTRMARLSEAGHEFEAYALGTSAQSLRIVIREIARPEDRDEILTFPRQDFASQNLMRERQQLSERDGFDFGGEDDDEGMDEDADENEEEAEETEEDASDYVDQSVISDDEEEAPM